jgi:hypothetical protein
LVYLHRALVGTETGKHTDHIDGNRLNNQTSDLRICEPRENLKTKFGEKGCVFKRVGYCGKKWRSAIRANYKLIHICTFDTEIEAAKAYNEAALSYLGEFCSFQPSIKQVLNN